jgi:CheY-like chemotaxis protein
VPIARILLVDDEPDIRTIGEMSLGEIGGFEVVTADSGAAAVAAASADPPDLVLLDVMMPELDGPATLRRLREDERLRGVPVVFLTAKTQKEEVERLVALGALGVLAKPFDPMTLPDELRALLREVSDDA